MIPVGIIYSNFEYEEETTIWNTKTEGLLDGRDSFENWLGKIVSTLILDGLCMPEDVLDPRRRSHFEIMFYLW